MTPAVEHDTQSHARVEGPKKPHLRDTISNDHEEQKSEYFLYILDATHNYALNMAHLKCETRLRAVNCQNSWFHSEMMTISSGFLLPPSLIDHGPSKQEHFNCPNLTLAIYYGVGFADPGLVS